METQNATRIFHVQGNDLKLAMPLTRRTVVTVNGKLTETDTDFFPSGEVTVFLTRNFHSYKYEAEVAGNVITVNDDGKLPVGEYAITVLCKDSEDKPFRRRHPQALVIVDNTADGGTYESAEYDTDAEFLDVVNRVSAIILTDDDVIIQAGGFFHAEDDGENVILRPEFGNSFLELTDTNAIINIRDNHE